MTLEKLRQITNNLPADTVLLIENDLDTMVDVKRVSIEYHADGRAHLVFTNLE